MNDCAFSLSDPGRGLQEMSGGITKTASVKIKPYYFRVSVDSPKVDYGNGTTLRIQMVDANGNQYYRTVLPSVRIRIADSLDYGTLWYGYADSSQVWQMADTLSDMVSVVAAKPFSSVEARFYANEKQPTDSVNVGIVVEKTGEGYSFNYVPPSLTPYQGRDTVRGATHVTVVQQSSEFAGFAVTLTRDTLEHRRTSDLTVTAVDKDGQEVAIDTSTAMMLTFDDGGPYVDFIRGPGDTVGTTLDNISYGTLRAGKVQIIAAKKTSGPPPVTAAASQQIIPMGPSSAAGPTQQGVKTDFPKSQITATQVSDVTKVGTKYVYLKPAIKVIAVQDSIKPFYPNPGRPNQYLIDTTESRTKMKVAVTVSGILYTLPLPYRVKLTSLPVDSSGGHSHTANRPTGYFGDSIRDTVKTKEFETGADTLRTSYLASMFGGKERIIATLTAFVAIADTDTVVVRVPGLQPLPSGNHNLITYTSHEASHRHSLSNSNNGLPAIVTAISQAVRQYASEYGMSGDIFLAAVDMSLPWGGEFDINGNWQSPHEYHRLGISIDFSSYYRDSAGNVVLVDLFRDDAFVRSTNTINQSFLDDCFDRLGFDRWEAPTLIHYESRN
jgi:hypothetical protein